MASNPGSTVAFAAALLVICILTLLLLRHYLPIRTTPAFLLIPVFLALALPSSIILLVPIDLASNAIDDEDGVARGIWLHDSFMLVVWRIAYWLTFALTWFVLPLLGEYVDSGHRGTKERFIYSLRANLRYQLIIVGCGAAVLVYSIFSAGFKGASIKGTVIAAAYAWGLILAIYLMGHGLVALPRRLYRSASISGRLRALQSHAPRVHDNMTEAIEELDNLELQVLQLRQRKTGTARDYHEWIEELADTSALPEARSARAPTARIAEANAPAVITERYLADLTRKLKRARHKRIRFVEEWDRLVRDALFDQSLLDAAASRRLDPVPSTTTSSLAKIKLLTPYTRYLLHVKVKPVVRVCTSILLALASLCIIWSEIFKSIWAPLSIVGLSIVHHPSATDRGKIGFAGQLITGAWLLYMCTAALASIREVRVWGNRALVRRHTYSESATWYAMQVAKLTVPLSYNFITFLPVEIYQQTTFYRFLGKLINLTPLGAGFSAFFPVFILVPVCAAAFGLYGRVKRIAGFGVLDDDSDENPTGFGTGGWREGKALIERETLDRVDPGRGNVLGLNSRDSSPPPVHEPPPPPPFSDNEDPTVSSQGQWQTQNPSRPYADIDRVSRRPAAPRARVEEEEEEPSFFQDFAHRVKNTIDNAERPNFNLNFSKPKWMGGGNDTGASGSGQGLGDGPGRTLGRIFGGRGDDGRLRL